jgi:hypothetical protein
MIEKSAQDRAAGETARLNSAAGCDSEKFTAANNHSAFRVGESALGAPPALNAENLPM